jgi:hypothetical protein
VLRASERQRAEFSRVADWARSAAAPRGESKAGDPGLEPGLTDSGSVVLPIVADRAGWGRSGGAKGVGRKRRRRAAGALTSILSQRERKYGTLTSSQARRRVPPDTSSPHHRRVGRRRRVFGGRGDEGDSQAGRTVPPKQITGRRHCATREEPSTRSSPRREEGQRFVPPRLPFSVFSAPSPSANLRSVVSHGITGESSPARGWCGAAWWIGNFFSDKGETHATAHLRSVPLEFPLLAIGESPLETCPSPFP